MGRKPAGQRDVRVFTGLPGFIEARLNEAEPGRQVEAMRAILGCCYPWMDEPDQYPNGFVSPRAVLARQVLMAVAGEWDDHRDYLPDWRP